MYMAVLPPDVHSLRALVRPPDAHWHMHACTDAVARTSPQPLPSPRPHPHTLALAMAT